MKKAKGVEKKPKITNLDSKKPNWQPWARPYTHHSWSETNNCSYWSVESVSALVYVGTTWSPNRTGWKSSGDRS